MSRRRNRGANNPRRRQQRGDDAPHAREGQRPGAHKGRSLAKALGPKAQQAAKKAAQKAKAGDFTGAAKIYRTLGDKLEAEGQPAMASRAYLRAAGALHRGGNTQGADKALDAAIAQAQQAPDKKQAMKHFRALVQRMRKNGNEAKADEIVERIKAGMGRQKLGRRRGRSQG